MEPWGNPFTIVSHDQNTPPNLTRCLRHVIFDQAARCFISMLFQFFHNSLRQCIKCF